jgi:hypothetical protein
MHRWSISLLVFAFCTACSSNDLPTPDAGKSDGPKTDQSIDQKVDAAQPDSVSPDSVSPDSVTPDSVTPDSVSPDSVSADFTRPDIRYDAALDSGPDAGKRDGLLVDAASGDSAAPRDGSATFDGPRRDSTVPIVDGPRRDAATPLDQSAPDAQRPDGDSLDGLERDAPPLPDGLVVPDARVGVPDSYAFLDYRGPDGTPPLPPTGKPIDILFVIDNSASMQQEQTNLVTNFPKLIDALRSHALGADGSGNPCTASNPSGCKIPDVHIGVVSTDLGAGNYGLPSCEVPSGDQGKLQNRARVAGCKTPSNPWISYQNGVTNVVGGTGNAIDQVKQAFSCIARLGVQGCGFEQTLEAARRALDPALNLNPGFLRANALLLVVFVTDEDDCSAAATTLYDPTQQGLNDPLGPLTSFRCFEFGIRCNINNRNTVGPRSNCLPAYSWLHSVPNYINFFYNLKPPGEVLMAAISGPTTPVAVGRDGTNPALQPSCQSMATNAVPAIRIQAKCFTLGGARYMPRW